MHMLDFLMHCLVDSGIQFSLSLFQQLHPGDLGGCRAVEGGGVNLATQGESQKIQKKMFETLRSLQEEKSHQERPLLCLLVGLGDAAKWTISELICLVAFHPERLGAGRVTNM